MRKLLITISLVLLIRLVNSQSIVKLYYDKEWKITSSEKYEYKREAGFDFNMVCFNGEYKDFDKNNNLVAKGSYDKGIKSGVHLTYFSDGTLKSSIEYYDNFFCIKDLLDETRKILVKNGTGKFSLPLVQSSGKEGTVKGEFLDYKRISTWAYRIEGRLTISETYKNGLFKEGSNYTLGGSTLKRVTQYNTNIFWNEVIENFEISDKVTDNLYGIISPQIDIDSLTSPARFPNGISSIKKIILSKIRVPREAYQQQKGGQVIVQLSIDKTGTPQDYKILKSVGKSFDEEAVRVLKTLDKKWFPAILNKQPYDSFISIPISFEFGGLIYPNK